MILNTAALSRCDHLRFGAWRFACVCKIMSAFATVVFVIECDLILNQRSIKYQADTVKSHIVLSSVDCLFWRYNQAWWPAFVRLKILFMQQFRKSNATVFPAFSALASTFVLPYDSSEMTNITDLESFYCREVARFLKCWWRRMVLWSEMYSFDVISWCTKKNCHP